MKMHLKTVGLLTCLWSGIAFAQDNAMSSSSAPAASAKSSAVGILVKDGKAFLLRGGQLTAVEQPLSLTVSPEGEITGFDGQTTKLPDGQMLTMDGRITSIPNPISDVMVPGLPAQKMPDGMEKANEEMARANSQMTKIAEPPMKDAGMMESSGTMDEGSQGKSGGNAGGNGTRNGTTNSTEKTSVGPR